MPAPYAAIIAASSSGTITTSDHDQNPLTPPPRKR